VLSESAAELIWPDQPAVGRAFTVGTRLGLGGDRVGGVVVGVVGDVRDSGPAARARPTLYVAHAQFPVGDLTVVARGRRDAASLVEPIRDASAALDPDVAVFAVRSMERLESNVVATPRLYLSLLGLFAAVAIALAAVGVYGVMAQNVAGRTREMGIRLALGADRGDVVWMVVRSALALSLAGIAGGWTLAFVARTFIARLLFGVGPTDPPTYATVGAAALGVAVVAAWLPARRAARIDPATTLRSE
jgi:predicted lysophospholipase L1 biosynthesis ABC-type transport system permease subunit